MSVFDKIQPLVSSEDGKSFELSFNTDDIIFEIIALTHQEITELLSDIEEQVTLLEEAYQNSVKEVG